MNDDPSREFSVAVKYKHFATFLWQQILNLKFSVLFFMPPPTFIVTVNFEFSNGFATGVDNADVNRLAGVQRHVDTNRSQPWRWVNFGHSFTIAGSQVMRARGKGLHAAHVYGTLNLGETSAARKLIDSIFLPVV